jgi:hypothetical protein
MCVTKAEYEELGSARCRRRFFHWETKLLKVFYLLTASTFQVNMCCFIEKGYRSLYLSWISIRCQVLILNDLFLPVEGRTKQHTRKLQPAVPPFLWWAFACMLIKRKVEAGLTGLLLKPETWRIYVHHYDMVKHCSLASWFNYLVRRVIRGRNCTYGIPAKPTCHHTCASKRWWFQIEVSQIQGHSCLLGFCFLYLGHIPTCLTESVQWLVAVGFLAFFVQISGNLSMVSRLVYVQSIVIDSSVLFVVCVLMSFLSNNTTQHHWKWWRTVLYKILNPRNVTSHIVVFFNDHASYPEWDYPPNAALQSGLGT